jgi:hypothetical protein
MEVLIMANNVSNKSPFTEREEVIIELLSRSFAGRMLDARIVDVHKQEGGLAATLRFTLDDTTSADLEREQIEASEESAEVLAASLAEDLRTAG